MLPRTDILINRVRQESDTTDNNSLGDTVVVNYLNDAQRTIQNLIFQSDKLNNVFTTYTSIEPINGQTEYDLPSNVYAENSIISVWTLNSNNSPGQRYSKTAFGEAANIYGYSVRNNKIVFSNSPSQRVLVVYNYRLPLMGLRTAQIASIAGQVITLEGSNLIEGFDSNSEYITIVDKYGTQIATSIYIDSLVGITLTVEGDITSAEAGQYIVSGKNSSSHSSLPEECETYLKIFTERKIVAHINSTKISSTSIFSEEERKDLIDLFEDKHSDIEYPVIVDYDYLDY